MSQLLERAVGQGMLTLDEFSERIDRTLAARTRGELGAVVADLPGMDLVHANVVGWRPTSSCAGGCPASSAAGNGRCRHGWR